MKWVRDLYDWVLKWADSPNGPRALFMLSFAEASFFPIPPDPLLIALVLGSRSKAFRFALYCSVASIAGALLGYGLGYFAWWSGPAEYSALANFFFDHIPGFTADRFEVVRGLYEEYNFWIVFTAGFTPLPYKVFTISGGAFGINLPMFLFASIVSRSARFFLVSALIWKFGPAIQGFIDKYFNLLAIGFTLLLVGGFFIIKYFL